MSEIKAGFTYVVEVVRHGVVIDREVVDNLMPTEGLHYLINAGVRGAAQVAQWYIGVFENDYEPVAGDTMATFPALAGESTAYSNVTRPQFTASAPVAGVTNNFTTVAELTFTAARTIYGAFLSSASGKGSTAGTLLSAAQFSAAKAVDADTILRVKAQLQLVSA